MCVYRENTFPTILETGSILRVSITENDRLSLNEDFYSSSKYDTKKALTILRILRCAWTTSLNYRHMHINIERNDRNGYIYDLVNLFRSRYAAFFGRNSWFAAATMQAWDVRLELPTRNPYKVGFVWTPYTSDVTHFSGVSLLKEERGTLGEEGRKE